MKETYCLKEALFFAAKSCCGLRILVSRARPFTQLLCWERVWSNSHSKLVLHCQHNCIRCGQLVLIVREVRFNSFLRAALMIALLNNCLVAKTSRAIFIHPHCLYSEVTATLNQLPVQEIPGPVETKPPWEFDQQTLSQRSDWVKGLARDYRDTAIQTKLWLSLGVKLLTE